MWVGRDLTLCAQYGGGAWWALRMARPGGPMALCSAEARLPALAHLFGTIHQGALDGPTSLGRPIMRLLH